MINKIRDCHTAAVKNLKIMLDDGSLHLIRMMIATSSTLWAILLLWSIFPTDNFLLVSPTQELLNSIIPAGAWIFAYAVQATVAIVGLLLNAKGKFFVLFDSILGALLYSVTTSVMIFSYLDLGRNMPPVWAGQITITIFSLWAVIRNSYE